MNFMIDALFQQTEIACFHNPAVERPGSYPAELTEIFDIRASKRAVDEISQWPGYAPTPLVSLDGLAWELGVAAVYYKDEAGRFGLGSFKSLGGAYEVLCLLQEQLSVRHGNPVSFADIRAGRYADEVRQITVATATDGNHGRSVAWGAQLFGCPCVIYIHAEVSEGRRQAMEQYGARVVRIRGNYDESVAEATRQAEANGWFIVSDTSFEGYTELPRHVMAGYTVMADEIAAQLAETLPELLASGRITHCFAQGGVGGLAGAMCGYQWQHLGGSRPLFVIVEPDRADCLYQSAVRGEPTVVDIVQETVMAGMSCGKVSDLAWKILNRGADFFLTIPDELIAPAMIGLAEGRYAARPVVAGESAVAGLSALMAACRQPELKQALGLDGASRILLYGTEGATDPEIYQRIVGRSAAQVAQVAAAGGGA